MALPNILLFHCPGSLSMCILLMLLFSSLLSLLFFPSCSSAAVSPRNILKHRFLLCANSLNAKKSSCFHMEAFKLFLMQKTNIFWQLQRNSACSGISIQTPFCLLDNHFGMRGSLKSRILSSISFLSHNKIQSLWSTNTYDLYLPHCCWVLAAGCNEALFSWVTEGLLHLHRGFFTSR